MQRPAVVWLAVLVGAAGALQLALGSHLIFFGDEWNLVLERRGHSAGVFLDPHQGHLVLGLVVIYKLLLSGFGMSSPLPFHVASAAAYLVAAVLLFAYLRRRVGDWLALMGTSVILFFGASALDTLSPFQMFFSGSIAAGLGALLALDRDDRRGDVIACGLLVVSISFGEVGIPFAVGALVRLTLAQRPLAGRLYVVGVPLALYALWWLGWGHTAPSYLSLENVGTAPAYVLDAVSTAVGALVGIASSGNQAPAPVGQQWAPGLLAVALALAAWRVWRLGRLPRGVWPVLAVGIVFWALAAFNESDFRQPDNGRYLYPSGVFLLLIASELFRGVRLSARALVATGVVTALAVAANLAFLSDNYQFRRHQSQVDQASLAALEIAGPVNPAYILVLGLAEIETRPYLAAVNAWGSPAYTEPELASSPADARLEADRKLKAILGLRLEPGGSLHEPCRTVQASANATSAVTLGAGKMSMRSSGSSEMGVRLGRFSDGLPLVAGSLRPGSPTSLTLPADRSGRLWRLGFRGHGPVTVCGPRVG